MRLGQVGRLLHVRKRLFVALLGMEGHAQEVVSVGLAGLVAEFLEPVQGLPQGGAAPSRSPVRAQA